MSKTQHTQQPDAVTRTLAAYAESLDGDNPWDTGTLAQMLRTQLVVDGWKPPRVRRSPPTPISGTSSLAGCPHHGRPPGVPHPAGPCPYDPPPGVNVWVNHCRRAVWVPEKGQPVRSASFDTSGYYMDKPRR